MTPVGVALIVGGITTLIVLRAALFRSARAQQRPAEHGEARRRTGKDATGAAGRRSNADGAAPADRSGGGRPRPAQETRRAPAPEARRPRSVPQARPGSASEVRGPGSAPGARSGPAAEVRGHGSGPAVRPGAASEVRGPGSAPRVRRGAPPEDWRGEDGGVPESRGGRRGRRAAARAAGAGAGDPAGTVAADGPVGFPPAGDDSAGSFGPDGDAAGFPGLDAGPAVSDVNYARAAPTGFPGAVAPAGAIPTEARRRSPARPEHTGGAEPGEPADQIGDPELDIDQDLDRAADLAGHADEPIHPLDLAGLDLSSPDRPGRESAGFDLTGRESAGFDLTGRESAGFDLTGRESAGFDLTGRESAGFDLTGRESAGFDHTGRESAGFEIAGREAADFEIAGGEAAGFEVAGGDAAGFDLSGREMAELDWPGPGTVGSDPDGLHPAAHYDDEPAGREADWEADREADLSGPFDAVAGPDGTGAFPGFADAALEDMDETGYVLGAEEVVGTDWAERGGLRHGDRVEGWVRPQYRDESRAVSGEYWTPVPASSYDTEYGWPTPVERLPEIPPYPPSSGFDVPAAVDAEPTRPVLQWPPARPDDRVGSPRSWSGHRPTGPAFRTAVERDEPARPGAPGPVPAAGTGRFGGDTGPAEPSGAGRRRFDAPAPGDDRVFLGADGLDLAAAPLAPPEKAAPPADDSGPPAELPQRTRSRAALPGIRPAGPPGASRVPVRRGSNNRPAGPYAAREESLEGPVWSVPDLPEAAMPDLTWSPPGSAEDGAARTARRPAVMTRRRRGSSGGYGGDDATQALPPMDPHPEQPRSRPRPRPRPGSGQPEPRSTVYVSRHAAEPS
ncbi:hypothetical protein GCM10020358_75350 [Amorphoplanes nipponensis]